MDAFLQIALSSPVPQDVRTAATAVIAEAQAAMPWIGGLVSQAGLIFNAGNWPRPTTPESVTSDPAQQQQWREFVNAYTPMTQQVLKGERAAAKAEGERLAADVAFWDRVHRITLAVATTGLSEVARLWNQLQPKLTKLKEDRLAARASMDAVRKTVDNPQFAATMTEQRTKLAQLETAQQQVTAGAVNALGPIAKIGGVREDLGLAGNPVLTWLTPAKLIAAGVSAVVLVSIMTAITVWVDRQAEVRMQANALANETLARENGIAEQLLRDGKIDVPQYQAIKAQNAKDAAIVRAANEAPGFASGLGKALGVSLGIGLLALIGYGIWKRTSRKTA